MSESDSFDELADRVDGLPWPGLVLAGLGAFVAGYLLTVVVTVVGPSSTAGGIGTTLNQLAFVFYSAHNVPLEVSNLGRMDWLALAARPTTPEPSTPVIVFYAIPVVVLLAAALVVAFRLVGRTDDPVRVGAAVLTFGASYAVAMVAGTFVFTSRSVFGGPARLVLEDAVLFGLAYPLVFGAIGAGIAGIVASVQAERANTPA